MELTFYDIIFRYEMEERMDKKINILVANDDGIDAEGIRHLADGLNEVGNIYVCAPSSQKSACGHGITIHNPIKVKEVQYKNAEAAFSIDGTPADCVKIGLELIEQTGVNIDMVFSGINMGGNMGTDVLYSGTVAAAIEGSLSGKPSVAVSVNSHKPKYYEMAKELARQAANPGIKDLGKEVILNINTPDLPKEEMSGVKIVGLGVREYEEWFEEAEMVDEHKQYRYSGRPVFNNDYDKDTNDIGAAQEKYATITPLHYDFTNYKVLRKLQDSDYFKK